MTEQIEVVADASWIYETSYLAGIKGHYARPHLDADHTPETMKAWIMGYVDGLMDSRRDLANFRIWINENHEILLTRYEIPDILLV